MQDTSVLWCDLLKHKYRAFQDELVDWARSLKKRHFMFKVDFEEACNLVSWGFLDYMLMRLGFGDKWTKLIYVIVSSSFTLALVNRGPIGEFKA